MISAGPDPGWYFDPDGGDHERYWNGEAWTEHRRSKPSPFNLTPQLRPDHRLHARNDDQPLHTDGTLPNKECSLTAIPAEQKLQSEGVLVTSSTTTRFDAESAEDGGYRSGVKLSLSLIEDLKSKGFSQSDIAEMFGVTRQYISWIKHTYGGRKTPREIVLQHFPWKVTAAQSQSSPYRRMRDHGEHIATGGVGMSDDKLKRLRSFYRKLRNALLVLEYDPRLPPIDGVSNRGGFAFRERIPTDGDLLIRVNEFTTLTDEGRKIWRLPPEDP